MVISDMLTMHRFFIVKPNPYIPKEEAEAAHTNLVLGEAATGLSILSLSLSIFRFMPNISLNSAFKRFTVFQFLTAFGFFAYYGFQLLRLKKYVPE